MKKVMQSLLVAAPFALAAGAVHANDIEGEVESVDAEAGTLVVQGIEFHTDDNTDYDDKLTGLQDIKAGQRVEIDFKYEGERHVVKEIEVEN